MNRVELLKASAESCGTTLSDIAITIMLEDLEEYPDAELNPALVRVRKEVRGKLITADIIDRIPTGRLSADELWPSVVGWFDISGGAIITTETKIAMDAARPAYESCQYEDDPDLNPARMAFRASYDRQKAENRGTKPTWVLKPGTSKLENVRLLKQGIAEGKFTQEYALKFVQLSDLAEQKLQIEQKHPAVKDEVIAAKLEKFITSFGTV